MARKIRAKLIMELREQGLSRRTIAKTRHMSMESVCEVFDIASERGIRNYTYDALERLCGLYDASGLANPAVIVDCGHNNSRFDFKEQPRIARSVMRSCRDDEGIARMVKGFMVESYLEEGCQPVGGGRYGVSITDPCLGWDDTERLLLELAEMV